MCCELYYRGSQATCQLYIKQENDRERKREEGRKRKEKEEGKRGRKRERRMCVIWTCLLWFLQSALVLWWLRIWSIPHGPWITCAHTKQRWRERTPGNERKFRDTFFLDWLQVSYRSAGINKLSTISLCLPCQVAGGLLYRMCRESQLSRALANVHV